MSQQTPPRRQFKIIHDTKCNMVGNGEEVVCDCAYASVVSLTNSLNHLTDKCIDLMHSLENSTPPAKMPLLADPIKQRLRATIFQDLDRVSNRMLNNWRSQT